MVLMYTGGTTGRAKGVLLDQRAEMLNFYHIGLAVDFGEDRVLPAPDADVPRRVDGWRSSGYPRPADRRSSCRSSNRPR